MNNIVDLSKQLKARKAVILARVSSKEQEEGYSIDAQTHRLNTYCTQKNLSIIKSFAITESSTQGDRKKFMDMIRFIKSQKEPIALVADKVDRLQRSFKEYPLLDELVNAGKIELHFNTENYIIHKDSISQERLMWSMSVIMAQSYIDSMRDNVKRSIEQKIRLGEWITTAPLGYLNIKKDNGKSWVVIDPERGMLVRRLFQEYATGSYTLSEMVKKAKGWGLKNKSGKQGYVNRSYIYKMLKNPFYYGKMRIKGLTYPHCYEPLISKELFDQCQAVLEGWQKKPFKYAGKEFVFRGLLKCATTGKVVTADEKKKTYKSGKTASWTYLRCWNPKDPEKKQWVREEKVLEQVACVFEALYIPEDILQHVTDYIRQTDHVEREYLRRHLKELHDQKLKTLAHIDALMELLMDKVICRDDYNRKRAFLDDQLYDIDTELKGHMAGNDGFKEALIDLLFIASGSEATFKGSTIEGKRQLVNFVFANLELKGDKLLYTLNKPFDLFVKVSDLEEWRQLVDILRTNAEIKNIIISNMPMMKSVYSV